MILITGATGHLGQATINSLLNRQVPASSIVALVRDEQKADTLIKQGIQIRLGNYNDPDSLAEALRGIDTLLLISSSEMGDRLRQHQQVIDAARKNGVKHIVYTGIDIKRFDSTVIPHVSQIHADTAAYLKTTGIPYTLLNNTLYADLIPLFCGDRVLEDGIFFPAGDGKVPFVARSEMGEAAAVILSTPGHLNQAYAITADTDYSFGDIASMLSTIANRVVTYHQPDADTYVQQLTQAGVAQASASFLASFGEAIKQGEFDTHRSDLERLLGRKPMTLNEFLESQYGH